MDKKNFISLTILCFLIIVAGTLSYYASNIKGIATAEGIPFAFNVYKIINQAESDFETINLYDTATVHNGTSGIVPGDSGNFKIKLNSTGSGVKISYKVKFSGSDMPSNLKFYLDSAKTSAVDFTNYTLEGTLDVNASKEYSIYWEWPYDSGEGNAEDINYQGKSFTIDVNIEGTQVK